jgi:hypothetical protein
MLWNGISAFHYLKLHEASVAKYSSKEPRPVIFTKRMDLIACGWLLRLRDTTKGESPRISLLMAWRLRPERGSTSFALGSRLHVASLSVVASGE